MEQKHTPGPWNVGSHRSIQSPKGTICETHSHMGIEEADANERLIAAAPQLLSEMLRYLPMLDNAESDPELLDRLTHGLGIATLNGYRAAISKATGKAS